RQHANSTAAIVAASAVSGAAAIGQGAVLPGLGWLDPAQPVSFPGTAASASGWIDALPYLGGALLLVALAARRVV
ncbi:MAG: hypothetical protein AAF698_07605, partial [Pseudomonadota bacterium]